MKDNVSIVNVLHRNTLSNTVMSVINMFVLIKNILANIFKVKEDAVIVYDTVTAEVLKLNNSDVFQERFLCMA